MSFRSEHDWHKLQVIAHGLPALRFVMSIRTRFVMRISMGLVYKAWSLKYMKLYTCHSCMMSNCIRLSLGIRPPAVLTDRTDLYNLDVFLHLSARMKQRRSVVE